MGHNVAGIAILCLILIKPPRHFVSAPVDLWMFSERCPAIVALFEKYAAASSMRMPGSTDNTLLPAQQTEGIPALSATAVTASTGIGQSTASVHQHEHDREDMSAFFSIGIIVNLTMFTALIIWGISQWKKSNARKK